MKKYALLTFVAALGLISITVPITTRQAAHAQDNTSKNFVAPVVFQAVVPGSHSGVRITLKNGNAVTLTRSGYTYTTSLPAAQVLAGYQQANMHNLVGYLDVFDGGTRTSRRNLIVNVRDATMPNVHVTKLSADMVASTHVVNMRDDELYWDGDIAPEVVRKFYNAFPDNFDFLAIVHQVDVGERHRSARGKEIGEREHGTARGRRRPAEHNPLTRDRVRERVALSRHRRGS